MTEQLYSGERTQDLRRKEGGRPGVERVLQRGRTPEEPLRDPSALSAYLRRPAAGRIFRDP